MKHTERYKSTKVNNRSEGFTGAVSELEAQVGASEAVDGDGQFDDLTPARAVVVVQHKGAVLGHSRLPCSQADAVL